MNTLCTILYSASRFISDNANPFLIARNCPRLGLMTVENFEKNTKLCSQLEPAITMNFVIKFGKVNPQGYGR